ncbi:TonB-dependent receptor plug domain-containing protein [Frigidibacter mobilis]|uniref:TonB-dependent receptor plug domain-containing protein n=1 Tax=Frigidibacter mobilis TaxID=1335048 RepID=A0A159YY94_9RHOB|nr:TonB-dependent receptor plug domain-containing protein [Frigidibacter mobilis]AMY67351.1 TonB-dependent receptor plug domain-containing protein [Frigidibacter mobilis]
MRGASALMLAVALSAPSAQAQTAKGGEDPMILDPIHVLMGLAKRFTGLGREGEAADTGTTIIGWEGVKTRSDGSGDANTALTSLPTVQYRNDTDTDAGVNVDTVLDLQPLELSISGGKTSDNNFMIDGVGINSVTGNEDPLGSTSLDRETGSPNINGIYGLHSQTQFVPESMIASVEVIDSNASAEYGSFQGGVVNYKLKQPSRQASGSVTLSYQDERFTEYHNGTSDGSNPYDVDKPKWQKTNFALDLTQPVGERTALLLGYSTRRADAVKPKDPQYRDKTVDSSSRSDFYRLGIRHDFEAGGTFTLTGTATDYDQEWRSNYNDTMAIDIDKKSYSLTAKYDRDFEAMDVLGIALSDVKFALTATYQDNSAQNLANDNIAYSWYGAYYSTGYLTDAFDAWCDTSIPRSGTGVACRTGGYGDRSYNDQRARVDARLSGDVWKGSFALGIGVERTEANRQSEGYINNSSTVRSTTATFVCPAGSLDCIDSQYFSVRLYQEAYDIDVAANKADAFFELNQTWGKFGLRAGLRADYNDYLKNLDIAPRLVGTWAPTENLTLSLGANRYYSGNYLTYAIHDGIPRSYTQQRSAAGGVVGEWNAGKLNVPYRYDQGGLDTPYVDEVTLGMAWRDGWSDGTWRARYIGREGKDQFARSQDSGSIEHRLTNEGRSEYQSLVLEYQKVHETPRRAHLDHVAFYMSGAWAERATSNDSYFGEEGDSGVDEFIWYDGKSYTLNDFNVVTGNLDIPVRATIEMKGSWQKGKYELGLGADIAFGYTGVRDTDVDERHDNPDYGSQIHDVFADYEFDATVSLNLSGKVRLAEIRGSNLDLDFKVSNLLDDTGNRSASTKNPWMPGRAYWLGTTYSW